MGKIIKYCSACDEDYAQKFVFCPTCGGTLETYEMKPVEAPADAAEPELKQEAAAMPAADEPAAEILEIASPIKAAAPLEEVSTVEPEPEAPIAAAEPEPVPVPPAPVFISKPVKADEPQKAVKPSSLQYTPRDGAFNVTVIQEKDGGKRNLLLLGALALVTLIVISGIVKNLFDKSLDDIAAINDDLFNATMVDPNAVATVDEDKPKNDKDAGGGGGGGKNEKEKPSQGDLANQTKDPIRPPDAKVPRLDDPSLRLPPPSTKGDKTFEQKYNKYGLPDGQVASLSNGDGSGGGIGSGRGTGQGGGDGTGAGNGRESGFGDGDGDGDGNGRGSGKQGLGEPPTKPVGVSTGIRFISKPKPGYTDEARQKQVTGSVLLKVTFLASGAVGSITTVKGLPYGLTDKAIAAARAIQFEPAKVNGVPQTITRTIEFGFTIY